MKSTTLNALTQLDHHPQCYAHLTVDITEQPTIAAHIQSHQGILITEWIAVDSTSKQTDWYVLYYYSSRWLCVQSPLHPVRPALMDLSHYFPVTNRLQRAIHDLTKISTRQGKDRRPWLSHGHFITGLLNSHTQSSRRAKSNYPFIKVSGDGVHEVPVGPVHAGIIEPGHFRFSVVGERIIKLEERLGYTHKGIHQLLIGKTIPEAAQLIGRVSGDSTIGYTHAFANACESLLGMEMDVNTQLMRAIFLERERLANHIGDISAIINDTGFATLATQFSILKEVFIRENATLTQHRYMMNAITPLQAIPQWTSSTRETSSNYLASLAQELLTLQTICDHHHGLQDRLKTTGIINQEIAYTLGLLGVAAKASNIRMDARIINRCFPYTDIDFIPITAEEGDVAARINVRFRECQQSIQMIQTFLTMLTNSSDNQPTKKIREKLPIGISCVEGWRGPICVAVQLNAGNHIEWCHFHDPSWQNWLALEYAVIGNIVADFPLINKSFNLSYSGQDS